MIAVRLGQWRPALRAAAHSAEQRVQMGMLNAVLSTSYWWAAIAFVELGHLEPAEAVAYLRAEAD
ncbi:MAG: hypothetical protein MUP97_16865 [Acidimicrobiia bacterium]|jgi:hypothetical protein|nr:hypothetical protein [Acidimicrobiia bacterium]